MVSKNPGCVAHQARLLVAPEGKFPVLLKIAQGNQTSPAHGRVLAFPQPARHLSTVGTKCLVLAAFLVAFPFSLGGSQLGAPVFTGLCCTVVAQADSGVRLD